MAVDSDRIVEDLDILENKPVCVVVILYGKTVKPLPFNQRMERFDASVVVRIAAARVAPLHRFCGLKPCFCYILASAVGMYD